MRRRRRKGLAGTLVNGIGNLAVPTSYEKDTLNPDEPHIPSDRTQKGPETAVRVEEMRRDFHGLDSNIACC